MKKNLLLTLVALLCVVHTQASDYFRSEGIRYVTTSETTVAVTKLGDGRDREKYHGKIIIPAKVSYNGITYSVTSIEHFAFNNCTYLTSVTIPNSVTSIGSYAFTDCTDLTSITIPNSVTSIGKSAFSGCKGLTSVTIPNSVTSIEGDTFRGCKGLTSVTIGNSVTSIGEWAFNGCSPTSVVWNAKSCKDFSNSSSDGRFSCSQIISFTFGEQVEHIPAYLCCGISKLSSITIPNSVTSIGEGAFRYCEGLTSVTIPNSVTSIGDYAFSGCKGLTSVTIPNSVTSIESSTFFLCSGLTSVTIPNSVTSIGEGAFSGCKGLTSITIPNSVTSIGEGAFSGCKGLTSVTIPNSVTSIEGGTFSGCTGLTTIVWDAKSYKDIPRSSVDAPFHYICSQITSFTFGEQVEHIPAYLCCDMSKLTSVTIPNSVTSIGKSAFSGCRGLTSVTIPNSVTSIGDYAFNSCTGLTSVTIPNSVTSIGDYAFNSCTGLTSVTIGNSVTSIGKGAFGNSSSNHGNLNITSIVVESGNTIYDSRNNCNAIIETSTNTLIQGCNTTIIPNSVTSIGEYAFRDCEGLTSVTIPNSVKSLGDWALSSCWNVTILSNELVIGKYAFGSSLSSITIGEKVRRIMGESVYPRQINVRAETPPTISSTLFDNIPTYTPVYIPCGTKETYQLASEWQKFTNFIESLGITLTLTSQDAQMGSVKIIKKGASCTENESVFEAIANEGYLFTQWSDGNTDNPRHLVLTQDTIIMAQFRGIRSYAANVDCNPEQGSVSGSGVYAETAPATLTATANTGYHFSRWSDGNTDNPRTLMLTQDTTITAEFAIDQHTITATCDPKQGVVTGAGTYDYGTQVTLTATANSGYEFAQWSNGVTYNPYLLTATEDLTLEAQFVPTTAVENVSADSDSSVRKVFRDGQVLILRGGKTYTTTGVEVK